MLLEELGKTSSTSSSSSSSSSPSCAPLDSLSVQLLFQMWLTHPSPPLSPPENTALQAPHVTRGPIQLSLSFPSFFFFFFYVCLLLAVLTSHLDCTRGHMVVKSVRYCLKKCDLQKKPPTRQDDTNRLESSEDWLSLRDSVT